MVARQGESFSSAWEADLGRTLWNTVGVLTVYRNHFMTALNDVRGIPFSRSRYLRPAISSISINGRVRSTLRRFIASHFSSLYSNCWSYLEIERLLRCFFEIDDQQFRVFFRKIAYRLYGFLKYLILTILNPSFAHLFLFYRTTPLGDKHCRCDVAGERKETERKVGSLISVTSKFRSLDFG